MFDRFSHLNSFRFLDSKSFTLDVARTFVVLGILIAFPSHSSDLSKFIFNPPLNENISVNELTDYNRENKVASKLRGVVTITPPLSDQKKNQCWILTKHVELPDVRICQKTAIYFEIKELKPNGELNWNIKPEVLGARSAPLRWTSPYRVAEMIPPEAKEPVWVPIRLCEALPGSNKILLHPFKWKSQWSIEFPKQHVMTPQAANPPNLYYQHLRLESAKPGETFDLTKPPAPYNFPDIKRNDPVTAHWTIPRRGAYEIPSKNFSIYRSQAAVNGTCRYHFKGAEDNPSDGWIECHRGFDFEVVKVNLSCLSQLIPESVAH